MTTESQSITPEAEETFLAGLRCLIPGTEALVAELAERAIKYTEHSDSTRQDRDHERATTASYITDEYQSQSRPAGKYYNGKEAHQTTSLETAERRRSLDYRLANLSHPSVYEAIIIGQSQGIIEALSMLIVIPEIDDVPSYPTERPNYGFVLKIIQKEVERRKLSE